LEVEFFHERARRGVLIREDEIATLTAAELKAFRIPRDEMHRCFAIAARRMVGVKPGDRVRPVADEKLDGSLEVRLGCTHKFTMSALPSKADITERSLARLRR
jgi:hypothetical protein